MIQTIVTATTLYITTTLDLLAILLMFFARVKTRKEYQNICIGQHVGSVTLIVISLFFIFVLNYVPEKWILGLLELILTYLGIRVVIYGDSDGEERAKKELNEKGLFKLVGTIAITTIASCGADNIGVFALYFVTLSVINSLITSFVFLILIFFLVFATQKLANIPGAGEIVEKSGRWIMAVIYIALGLLTIIENDTIQTVLGFISQLRV